VTHVVDDAALGRNFFGALLLMLGSLLKAAVTEDLQIDETEANDRAPQNKDARQDIESEICAVAGCAGGH
jgi:hypothetical protein